MQLTPNDIRNQQFSTGFRGYNKAEVDAFKERISAALEETRVEISKMTEEKEMLTRKYEELKKLEETIKKVVIEAQKSGEQIIANARKEAELIVSEGKQRRDRAIDEMHTKLSELETNIHELEFTRKSFYNKLRAEIEAHLKLVDSIQPRSASAPPTVQKQVPPSSETPAINRERPRFDASKDEIDRIVDQFGEEPQEEEKVNNGKYQGDDF
jgi:cell division initiation protein